MQRTTPRNRNATRLTAPTAMKRVGGGYVMREGPDFLIEPVRPRMTQIDVLKRKNEALSHSLEEKTTELETALAKIRQLEIEKEEELDFLFYHYEKEKSKKKAAVKKLEVVEKSLKHVLESFYLRTSGRPNMKDGLGRMQELAESLEEKVDGSVTKKESVGSISCGATEASGLDSAPGDQDLSSEETESCGEEEDYWFWQEPPGWPHFAIRDGIQDGLNEEEPTLRGMNQEGSCHSSENACKIQEEEKEEKEKDDSTCNEPPGWPHFAIRDGMAALYSEECFKYYEGEAKEPWCEDPEWLHVAAQDSGQDGNSKQASRRLVKKQSKKIGILFRLLKCLIAPCRMVQKINQDEKRQGGGDSSKSWIALQENLVDNIISSSKKWTKQDEQKNEPSRYSVSMRKDQEKVKIYKAD